MFSVANEYIMIFAVILSMGSITAAIYYVNKLFINNTKEILVRFILLVFTALVGVFVVDKIIAFRTPLLSDNQNDQLFDLIKTLTLMIFSYYFGTKKEKDAT
jgi:O-antigen/teichoic acid export membrane protein